MATPTLDELPLRARKQARTRLALVDAALARLAGPTIAGTPSLDDLAVKELCAAAGISEASFFNYFPQKSDLLVYFVQLWSLELAGRVHALPAGTPARAAIEDIFVATARQARERPRVMAELLAHQARLAAPPDVAELPLVDRLTAFPDRPELARLPSVGLDGLLPPLLARAVAEGALPAHVDRQAAFLGLAALFVGIPTLVLRIDPALVEPAYRAQLALYWAGLAATPSPAPPPPPARRPARLTGGRAGRPRRSR